MNKLKPVLFYVLGLAGLVALSVYMTGQVEVDITPLPTSTPRQTPTPRPTATVETGCVTTPGGSRYGYRAGAPLTDTLAPPDLPGARLVIAGAVYAADCETPLAGITIEAWQNDASGLQPIEPGLLRARQQTDRTGRYRFTTIKPGHSRQWPPHIHFRLSNPLGEELLTTAAYFDSIVGGAEAAAFNSALKVPLSATQIDTRSVLSGTFDIVLPVEPPDETKCLTSPPSQSIRHDGRQAPFTTTLASPGAEGSRLVISGAVLADDERTPLPGAVLEVWHADAAGRYEQDSNRSFRAKMETDAAGQYRFTTIRPGYVQVGCEFLPAHINYLVSYQDYRPLFVTQFFAGDPYLAQHPQMRAGTATVLEEVRSAEATFWRGAFDIVLPVSPPAPNAGP